ncbi:hypothetical protein GJ496_007278 [Pomphorhynchus laevis]|nr:hypothetical protein GJ496_007278 [Pomphorhynchus laevis]
MSTFSVVPMLHPDPTLHNSYGVSLHVSVPLPHPHHNGIAPTIYQCLNSGQNILLSNSTVNDEQHNPFDNSTLNPPLLIHRNGSTNLDNNESYVVDCKHNISYESERGHRSAPSSCNDDSSIIQTQHPYGNPVKLPRLNLSNFPSDGRNLTPLQIQCQHYPCEQFYTQECKQGRLLVSPSVDSQNHQPQQINDTSESYCSFYEAPASLPVQQVKLYSNWIQPSAENTQHCWLESRNAITVDIKQNGWTTTRLTRPLQQPRSIKRLLQPDESSNCGVKSELNPTEAKRKAVYNDRPIIKTCGWADENSGLVCNKYFDDVTVLASHLSNDHLGNGSSCKHICQWIGCSRNHHPFKAKYKLVNHLRVHTGERPFQCDFPPCRKLFARSENLKIHTRVHTGEKPFQCPKCDKRFANSSDRKKHFHVHSENKPFQCSIEGCGKTYTHPSSLRKHLRRHDEEQQDKSQQPIK